MIYLCTGRTGMKLISSYLQFFYHFSSEGFVISVRLFYEICGMITLSQSVQMITGGCVRQDSEQKDYINVKGCVPQFEKWLQDNLTLVAGIFIGVALLQASSIHLFSLYDVPVKNSSIPYLFFWKKSNVSIFCWFFFHPQIFGICLAQNLVSDIEAVRASW